MKYAQLFFLLMLWIMFHGQEVSALPTTLEGKSVIDGEVVQVGGSDKKGLVVVFLSAHCPCSDSHLAELKNLSQDYPEFDFVGIHSNTDEAQETAVRYFEKVDLPFSVLRDSGAKIADEFKALKTPHAFVIAADGSTAYQGGVSSSRNFDEDTDRKYLREALSDVSQGKKVRTPYGRTLGCVITRGGANVW